MQIKINKNDNINLNSISVEHQIKKFINKLKFLDLVDAEFVKSQLSITCYTDDYFRKFMKRILPQNYVKMKGGKLYYGSTKTIQHIKNLQKVNMYED